MDNQIPFPQANSFEKIIALINVSDEKALNSAKAIQYTLGEMTERQISYYISAATFLGLVRVESGKRYFTDEAKRIRSQNSYVQKASFISIILLNPIFNKIYVNTLIFGKQELDDIIGTIREYYPQYSKTIFERRAQAASKWIDWILTQTERDKQ